MSVRELELVLAPMVRVGTLPMRLLALAYGAHKVYTEELIDWKILRSTRVKNEILNTVDFIDQTDGTIVFRTCPEEKSKVVLQLGTSDAERALKAGKMVEDDVSAIDINMGCPKQFSIQGGMGVALMQEQEKATLILKTLVDNLKIPVSCKIRIFPTKEETLDIVKKLASSGIYTIAIHGRTKDERPQHFVHADVIKYVAERVNIPVIANGGSKEIESYADINKFREATGCDSIMLARAAEWNCSIFRKQGLLPLDEVIIDYLKIAIDYDSSPSNTKYCIQNMLRELQNTPKGKLFLECQTMKQICSLWNLEDYCQKKQDEYQNKGIQGRWEVNPESLGPPSKKPKLQRLQDAKEMKVRYIRSLFSDDTKLPKTLLHTWALKEGYNLPTYETHQEEKLFRSIVMFNGQTFASTFWEKNKKFAEQGGALVCLCSLGLINEDDLVKNGSLLR